MQKFIVKITQENDALLNDDDLGCFILSDSLKDAFCFSALQKAQKNGKLVLSESVEKCLAYGTDGVLLDFSASQNIAKDYAQQTQKLKKKIVGAICRNRRHEAMLVSECEPDFVVFKCWHDGWEKIKELTDWYGEMFLIQSALMPVEDLNFDTFKTDFVILTDKTYKNFLAKNKI